MNSPLMLKTGMVEIKYTCHRCRTKQRSVLVRSRPKEENILKWMKAVNDAVVHDHQKHAPYCSSKKVDLMIPLPPGDGWVGQEVSRVH